MTANRTIRKTTALGTTAVVALSLAACTGGTAAVSTTSATGVSTPAATPEATAPAPAAPASGQEEAVSVVRDYLAAVQSERYADAYALLSVGAQSLAGSEQQFAETALFSIVHADEAAGYLGADGRISAGPGPLDGSWLVTGARGRVADAWLVRSTPQGPRIDDAGVPPTGQSPYEWVNPASGPEDVRESRPVDPASPAAIIFTDTSDAAAGTSGLVGYPDELKAYVGTSEVETSAASSEVQRRWDIALDDIQIGEDAQALTIAWTVDAETDVWRTSTTALFVE